MFPSTIASLTQYFVRKQTSMMAVIQVITGAAGIVWPSLTNKLLEEYGFRGTVAIFSAISLHGIPAVLTLQPAKRHYKQKELKEDEEETNPENCLANTKLDNEELTDENLNIKTR